MVGIARSDMGRFFVEMKEDYIKPFAETVDETHQNMKSKKPALSKTDDTWKIKGEEIYLEGKLKGIHTETSAIEGEPQNIISTPQILFATDKDIKSKSRNLYSFLGNVFGGKLKTQTKDIEGGTALLLDVAESIPGYDLTIVNRGDSVIRVSENNFDSKPTGKVIKKNGTSYTFDPNSTNW